MAYKNDQALPFELKQPVPYVQILNLLPKAERMPQRNNDSFRCLLAKDCHNKPEISGTLLVYKSGNAHCLPNRRGASFIIVVPPHLQEGRISTAKIINLVC